MGRYQASSRTWNCVWELRDDGQPRWLADARPSRAVSRNRSSGSQRVLGVEPDRFEHEVELIGAVDLARYRVGHAGPCRLPMQASETGHTFLLRAAGDRKEFSNEG